MHIKRYVNINILIIYIYTAHIHYIKLMNFYNLKVQDENFKL